MIQTGADIGTHRPRYTAVIDYTAETYSLGCIRSGLIVSKKALAC